MKPLPQAELSEIGDDWSFPFRFVVSEDLQVFGVEERQEVWRVAVMRDRFCLVITRRAQDEHTAELVESIQAVGTTR